MSVQHVTAGEARVIALAAREGKSVIDLEVRYPRADGEIVAKVPFCGLCGRMVCHPSCTSGVWGGHVA